MLLNAPRKSYLGFPCSACRAPITAMSLLAELATPVISQPKTITLECPRCGHRDEYELPRIARFEQHQLH